MPESPRIGRVACAAALIATAAVTAPSTAAAAACTPVPPTIAVSRLLTSGKALRVHAGAIVFAVIVEPAKYATSTNPRTFPWVRPTASGHGVLRAVPVCGTGGGMTTLPRTVTAFRASRTGQSTVTAALAPAWRAVAGRPHAFRATVTVVG